MYKKEMLAIVQPNHNEKCLWAVQKSKFDDYFLSQLDQQLQKYC